MKRAVAMIASILQLAHSAMLVGIGAAGIFTARRELATGALHLRMSHG
ncbi:hypothetical protein [Bradyrhizobium sp. Tv2a-2]|nr:hypothetical protein [Bradyrhizobium sp. Tv2a-2]